MTVRFLRGDMREKLEELADCSIDSIVTDPPYHLTNQGGGPHGKGENTPYSRSRAGATTAGFMGMKWDGGDVAMRPETWALLLRVAKPGAHLLAFGSSRTFHRVWTAVEDAGWEIRDTLMWLHGEGFPKSSNQKGDWQGWGTALKPAFEPILLARKPLIGTVAENLATHRVGALNIDACRVEAADGVPVFDRPAEDKRQIFGDGLGTSKRSGEVSTSGRWPANVLHDGSDEVIVAFPIAPGQKAAEKIEPGERKTQRVFGTMNRGHEASAERRYTDAGGTNFAIKPGARRLDSGTAARFFWCPKASPADRDDGLEGGVNPHPTVKPTELMQYLCRLVTPRGGVVLDPFMGSGSTGKAATLEGLSFVGIELQEQYIEIARRRIVGAAPLFTHVEP